MNPLKVTPTREDLLALFDYDPDTGILTRKISTGSRARAGAAAGYRDGNGYLQIGIKGRLYYAHRIIWAMIHGSWPPNEIDHINGNPTDNGIKNLRLATSSENNRNTKRSSRNTSGVKGVYLKKGLQKWQAEIIVNSRYIYLGIFTNIEDAAAAYAAAAEQHFGEFKRLA